MTGIDPEMMKKVTAMGPEFMAKQRKHVEEVAAKEAARRAALGDDTLPEGAFDTKEEAEAFTRAALAAGKYVIPFDETGALTIEISSPFTGRETVWITNVTDTDPNPPLEAHMGEG